MIKTLRCWLIVLLFFLGFSSNIFSQQNWELLNPTPTSKTGKNVQFVSNNIGYIITDTEILETLDSGISWKKKQDIVSGNDLKFHNNIGFIVGNLGYVLKSTDSGASWTQIQIGYNDNLNTVNVIDGNTIIVSSANSLITSLDGGNTWEYKQISKGSVVKTFFTSNLIGHAACKNGTMLKTIDGGVNWYATMTSNVTPSNFFTVYFINKNIGFATQEHDDLYKTIDGGETWIQINNITDALFSFSFLNENVGYAAGEHGSLFKTTDGGITWNWVSFQNGRIDGTHIYGLYFLDENTGFATGQRGRIVKTTDGGKTWTENSPTYNSINKLDFLTKDIGYAQVGNSFYKTVNAGKKWSFVGQIDGQSFYSVSTFDFIDENNGYAATGGTYGGQFFKTKDGGVTWEMLGDVIDEGINTMVVINQQTIYISGGYNQQKMMKSIDGGNTWEERSQYSFYRMQFLTEDIAYAHNRYDKKIYKTIDGGYNWRAVFTGDEEIQSIDFTDIDNGYIVGSNALIYKTKNGGLNWQKLTIPYEYYTYVKFFSKNVGYIFDEEGQLFKTENGGITWEKNINFVTGFTNPQSIHIIDKDIYLAGVNGKIMKSQVDFKPYYLELDPAVDVHTRFANLPGTIMSNDGEIDNIKIEVLNNNAIVKTVEVEPNKVSSNSSLDFKIPVWDLNPDTYYVYRITAIHNNIKIYSESLHFKTEKNYKIVIDPINEFSATNAVISGSITSYEDDISDIEIECSNEIDFSKLSLKNTIVKANTTEKINGKLLDLKPKTLYYVRVKAVQNGNVIYSDVISFTTKSDYEIMLYYPNENENGTVLNAYVLSNDKDISNIVFEYGVMNYEKSISTTPDKVTANSPTFVNAVLTDLDKTKVYFYRLKALNGDKVIYSNTEILNYSKTIVLAPEAVSNPQNNSIELKGILNPAGYFLTNVEFQYGTTENFGSALPVSSPYFYGTTTSVVKVNLENLLPNQKYYYRLKASNGSNIVYSDVLSFSTGNLGIEDFNYEKNVMLYPNPTNGVVNIQLNENKKITSLKVIDQSGRVISHRNNVNLEDLKIIDLSHKPTGIYYLEFILDNSAKINKKVILK
ncbi:Por secretion system C-terminal sorting domain-containing protein [Flavobacterium sp. CF108]|uniref:YCF48-related protein n=1 Tax=unclassified Flavobacterium TaxID=196869 RepID=UPI0008D1C0AA|nr:MULTISPECIES: YCF48-related protein [unclassified Flavobacterium]SEO12862.1 Por secretion system C-terminal sorting domain-containing protein [Flavobacterium sp. fv08]SHG59772.1 Por secretion system C-terminal sorting domain-containing protein [Flavobacterium sp. CF108]